MHQGHVIKIMITVRLCKLFISQSLKIRILF